MSQNAKRLRVLLADDHEVLRRGAREILNAHRCIQVVGEAADGQEAVDLATKLKPNVAIVDIQMPTLGGLAATRKIRETAPEIQIVIYTLHESHEIIRESWEAGARGLVLKSETAARLLTVVKAVARGESCFTSKATEIMMNGILKSRNVHLDHPTQRELKIISLLAVGKTNKDVAAALGVTPKSAESYREKIMLKLNFHCVNDFTLYAVRNNLITP